MPSGAGALPAAQRSWRRRWQQRSQYRAAELSLVQAAKLRCLRCAGTALAQREGQRQSKCSGWAAPMVSRSGRTRYPRRREIERESGHMFMLAFNAQGQLYFLQILRVDALSHTA
jgi:hypothetical protein